jgi:pilus assembly protein CpaC
MIGYSIKQNKPAFLRLALVAAVLFSAQVVRAQQRVPSQPAIPPAQTPAQEPAPQPEQASTVQGLHLLVGRSLVISSPARIKRISLADPNIAEAVAVSPYQVLVNGKAPGGTSLLLWDEQDRSQDFEVSVDIDIEALTARVHELFPSEPVQINTAKDVVMVSGQMSSSAVADKILELVKNSAPKVTDLMQVPPPLTGEILLEVKFADVNRSIISQLGINIISLPGAKTVGTVSTQQFAPPQLVGSSTNNTQIGLSDLLNIFVFRPDINLAATIQALENNNLIQILAEPNLMTVSGKEASFLAGGQFPFPILQSSGGGGGFAGITIQFKEFGVRLSFTPTLMPDGSIHLKVAPEVSSLDFSNALTIQGFVIPALATNRVESEVDLKDGQSFAIAGLLDNRVSEQLEKIPGIGDIPILGKLFQSRSLTRSKNELLIVVTPRIVHPLNSVPAGPVMPKPFLGSPAPAKPQPQN